MSRHRDDGITRKIPNVALHQTPTFGVKFPLVDTDELNGSIDVVAGSQYLVDPKMDDREWMDDKLNRGAFPGSRRLNLKRGSVWFQDGRAFHRGTPHLGGSGESLGKPRAELVVCYSQTWYRDGNSPLEITEAEAAKLSELGQHPVRHQLPAGPRL